MGTRPTAAAGSLPPAAIGIMLLLCAVWGLNMVAVKLGNQGIAPALQAGLRSILAALLLAGWCAWRGICLRGWAQPALLLPGIAAGIMFGLEFLLIYIGLGHTTAARAVVFLYAAPFFVAAGTHWLLPEDRLTLARAAGLVVAFAGIVIAFAEDGVTSTWRGDMLLLLAGCLWGATTVLVKVSALRRARAELTLMYQLVVSIPVMLLASPLLGESWAPQWSPVVVLAFLYQAAGIAFVSYTAWFWLVATYSASRLSAFSFLTPILGVAFGALILGDPLHPAFGLSVLLVAIGLWLVNRPAAAAD